MARSRFARAVGADGRAGALAKERDDLGQVLAVRLDRVGGRVLFEAEVAEEVGQGLVHRCRLAVNDWTVSPSRAPPESFRRPAFVAGPVPSGLRRRTRRG